MGFADVYTIVTRESGADPNVTSGAASTTTETLFWYFGKHQGGRQGGAVSLLLSVLGLVPVLAGLGMMV